MEVLTVYQYSWLSAIPFFVYINIKWIFWFIFIFNFIFISQHWDVFILNFFPLSNIVYRLTLTNSHLKKARKWTSQKFFIHFNSLFLLFTWSFDWYILQPSSCVILIKVHRLNRFLWLSLIIYPYGASYLATSLGGIQSLHNADECMILLVTQRSCVHE